MISNRKVLQELFSLNPPQYKNCKIKHSDALQYLMVRIRQRFEESFLMMKSLNFFFVLTKKLAYKFFIYHRFDFGSQYKSLQSGGKCSND